MTKIAWPNQFAHMLFSTSVLLGRTVWFPKGNEVTWAVVVGLVVYAALKEFIEDVYVEKSQGVAGAAIDFAFYTVGTVGTSLALYFTGKF